MKAIKLTFSNLIICYLSGPGHITKNITTIRILKPRKVIKANHLKQMISRYRRILMNSIKKLMYLQIRVAAQMRIQIKKISM